MSKDYKAAVFIGRFQPFHSGHLEVAQKGLELADQLIFVIGSAYSPATIKNPWSLKERKEMIMGAFDSKEHHRINIVGVRDYFYSDETWVTDIKSKVGAFVEPGDSVTLIGNIKDESSYYLKYFSDWEFKPVRTSSGIDATAVRDALFKNAQVVSSDLPSSTIDYLRSYAFKNGIAIIEGKMNFTEALRARMEEQAKIAKNKTLYGTGPFVTTDAVVMCCNHILLIKRGEYPGKGLFALPGGFLRPDERLIDGALRELKEETGIRTEKKLLLNFIKSSHVFDHPSRSLRGRTITHAYFIDLPWDLLPEVRGNDDAEKAIWVPIMDLNKLESRFYEDHAHIINHFLMGEK